MDILFFLKDRTRLIRQYYVHAAAPFNEIIRKIEAEESPYVPPYSEDGEPPFLTEWIEANELLEITARCCVSMLAGSMQLYLDAWTRELRLEPNAKEFKTAEKKCGWLRRYRACLMRGTGIDWAAGPADLGVIEQVVLARNRDQHPESLTSIRVAHSRKDLQRYPRPFFANDGERELFADDTGFAFFMSPTLHVSEEKLMTALEQVELLCAWLEEKYLDCRFPGRLRAVLPSD